jgi:hypothetical protein
VNTDRFLDTFGTRTGRWLANRLSLSGAGSVRLANMLSSYAWNMRAADTLRNVQTMKGQSTERNAYRDYCALLRLDIEDHPLFPAVSRRIAFW